MLTSLKNAGFEVNQEIIDMYTEYSPTRDLGGNVVSVTFTNWSLPEPPVDRYLAALQDIPTSLVEAGMIDGASAWQRFWRIKWPLLGNATFFVVMMLTINSFKSFDLIYALTEGGPGTATTLLSQYIYNQSFVSWDYGRASAAAMVLFAIVAVITLIQFRLEKKFSNE